nr:hypothetical protein [Bacteroidota bacterium]
MQTITITPQLENGRFYIDLPEDLRDVEFTIQIIVNKAEPISSSVQEKLNKIRPFAGIVSDSRYYGDKTEWYLQ